MSRPLSAHRRVARGPIEEHAVYPLATFLKRLGIGRHSLTAMRKRGLPVRSIGRRTFIDGAEALEFLRAMWNAEGNSDQPQTTNADQQAGRKGQP
jgi:hypothetical protein